jgi:2-keto-4-pentenoate hydratase/2-oxohepta-3-ene-1,7-dioic acid hydratase in catechol pathway
MRIARIASPTGGFVLARVDGNLATPIATCLERPGADTLRDLLRDNVDVSGLGGVGPQFTLDGDVTWRAPVQSPGKIIAVGLNYADHVRETNLPMPKAPMIFAKFGTSLVGHRMAIECSAAYGTQLDYEGELAVVIGQTTRNVAPPGALDAVFGYTVCNDVSARDAQFGDGQFTRGKSFDTFCPVGPMVVTPDEVPDPRDLRIQTRVNGTVVQDSSTKEMIFGVAEIISYLSTFITLEPGDLITTGSPAGVGMTRVPPVYLRDGDVVEIEIEGVGLLVNPVVVT